MRFRKIQWGHLMAIVRTVWGPKVSTLKGTEVSLSHVQCFLYLVFSLVNVSIFHITWLDTFWAAYTGRNCYRLNVRVSPPPLTDMLKWYPPVWWYWEVEPFFGKWAGHKGRTLMIKSVPLEQRPTEQLWPFPMCGHKEKSVTWHNDLGLPASRTMGNKYLLFISLPLYSNLL